MLGSKIFAVASMVLGALAAPVDIRDNSGNYEVTIINKCSNTRSFAAYQIAQPSWTMSQLTKTLALEPKTNGTLSIPFNAVGVRISDQADKGLGAQWQAPQLVELGYSTFMGLIGTAYDLSMMEGSDKENWLSVCPKNQSKDCACKVNNPALSALDKIKQVWTNANQVASGSQADTTCMNGKQDFIITWC